MGSKAGWWQVHLVALALACAAAGVLSVALACGGAAQTPPRTVEPAPANLQGLTFFVRDVQNLGTPGNLHNEWLTGYRQAVEQDLQAAGLRIVTNAVAPHDLDVDYIVSADSMSELKVISGAEVIESIRRDTKEAYQCGHAFDAACIAASARNFYVPPSINNLLHSPRLAAFAARPRAAGGVAAPAYAPPTSAAPSPATGGCTKDSDCKGDRICERGQCVAPR